MLQQIQTVPRWRSGGGAKRSRGSHPVAERNPPNFVPSAGQFQRQLPESPKAIVEEIFAHVVTFGEDENFHPVGLVKLIRSIPHEAFFVVPKRTTGSLRSIPLPVARVAILGTHCRVVFSIRQIALLSDSPIDRHTFGKRDDRRRGSFPMPPEWITAA
jgi:hypothetical protein